MKEISGTRKIQATLSPVIGAWRFPGKPSLERFFSQHFRAIIIADCDFDPDTAGWSIRQPKPRNYNIKEP